jgi:hypothetical protein
MYGFFFKFYKCRIYSKCLKFSENFHRTLVFFTKLNLSIQKFKMAADFKIEAKKLIRPKLLKFNQYIGP